MGLLTISYSEGQWSVPPFPTATPSSWKMPWSSLPIPWPALLTQKARHPKLCPCKEEYSDGEMHSWCQKPDLTLLNADQAESEQKKNLRIGGMCADVAGLLVPAGKPISCRGVLGSTSYCVFKMTCVCLLPAKKMRQMEHSLAQGLPLFSASEA